MQKIINIRENELSVRMLENRAKVNSFILEISRALVVSNFTNIEMHKDFLRFMKEVEDGLDRIKLGMTRRKANPSNAILLDHAVQKLIANLIENSKLSKIILSNYQSDILYSIIDSRLFKFEEIYFSLNPEEYEFTEGRTITALKLKGEDGFNCTIKGKVNKEKFELIVKAFNAFFSKVDVKDSTEEHFYLDNNEIYLFRDDEDSILYLTINGEEYEYINNEYLKIPVWFMDENEAILLREEEVNNLIKKLEEM